MKHTRGPWKIKDGEIYAGRECLGVVYRTEAWTSGEPVETDDQANARLISASPDLAKALGDLLNCVDGQHDDEWLERCKAGARAALSKAKAERR